jgi:hypothetical protein
MHRFCVLAAGLALSASLVGSAQPAPAPGPYRVLRTVTVGGAGGFDYVYADAAGRRLYVPRSGAEGHISVFNLDTLAPAGEIPNVTGHGAVVDPKSGHGFASSRPVAMFDTKTLAPIKTIDVQGNPDGILFDDFNERVWILSHRAPNATIIDAKDGSIVGTVDLGGAPEQAATDGRGHVYVDVEDQANVAVVDAKTLQVTAHYAFGDVATVPAGLAFDVKNHVLFVACRNTPTMVMLNSDTGKVITSLPIGTGVDGAGFNPATMEAFSSQGDGTLTVIKESSPTSFAVEQTVQTKVTAKTMTIDSKTGRIFLIAADFGAPATPPPAGGRSGRGPMVPGSFSILEVGK